MSPREVTLVVNPASRRGAAAKLVEPVCDILRAHDWTPDVVITKSAEHAYEIAAQADSDDLLVALGGDGLHGRVAAGAVESGCVMAPLPAGRGHDFVRALGASSDVVEAAGALATAVERRLDVGLAGDDVFLGVATIGYDSRANTYANAAPDAVPSALVYAYGGARALLHTRPHPVALRVDGVEHRFTGWNIAIGNSGRYGAGMKVNPHASMTDGMLDVTVVKELPRWRYPVLLPKLFRGTHIDGVHVCHYRGRRIEVLEPADGDVYADGDLLDSSPRVFEAKPAALRVLSGVAR